MRRLERIPLGKVQLSESRPSIPDTINALAESMSEIGLTNPVTVKLGQTYQKGIFDSGFIVVAGNHRVGAARALGWNEIDAFVVEGLSEDELELIEIDENLRRAELSPAQKADWIYRRKQVWERLHPETDRISVSLGGRGNKNFAGDTQKITGEDRRRTNEHASRAEALGDDIKRVAGTSLDKGVELDALKDLDEPVRKELIERAASGEKVSARNYGDDRERIKRLVKQSLNEVAKLAGHGTPDEIGVIAREIGVTVEASRYLHALLSAANPARKVA